MSHLPWGTIREAMALWRVSRATIARWRRLGLITWKRSPSGTPRILLVDKADIDMQRIMAPRKPRPKKQPE